MPLFHTAAWDHMKLYFMQQGSVVLVDRFEAESAVTAIARHRCTTMFGVPLILRQMLESAAWREADLSAIRLVVYASFDPTNLIGGVVDAFRERGASAIGVAQAYGLTEAGPFLTILRSEEAQARPTSIGTPLPGVSVALLDDGGLEVAQGETGEICVRGPCRMTEYLNRPEASEEAFQGGWFHTGDLGRIDEDGLLFLVDRKKAMIRTGTENVYAREVESRASGPSGCTQLRGDRPSGSGLRRKSCGRRSADGEWIGHGRGTHAVCPRTNRWLQDAAPCYLRPGATENAIRQDSETLGPAAVRLSGNDLALRR
jgi:acyl-CoA synthetase (AMP-forming)/AMP-acid ligase II